MIHTIVVEAGNGKDKNGKVTRTGVQNFNTYREGGFVAVGWLPNVDLSGKNKADIAATVDAEMPAGDNKDANRNLVAAKRVLTSISQIKPGDLIVVPGATHRIYGVGVATSGYKFAQGKMDPNGLGDDNRNHYVDVLWLEWSVASGSPSYLERAAFIALGCATLWPSLGFTISVSDGAPEYLRKAPFWSKVSDASSQILANIVPTMVVEEPEEDVEDDVEVAPAEPKPYTGDPFTVNETGHYIGNDGFIVPQNFMEFYEAYPKYVQRWVQKRIYRNFVDDDVMDWEADLLMHLHYLPERSKARTPGYNNRPDGCHDVIESFNPTLQYGASAPRFFNYIKKCLNNRFNTLYSKYDKNPVCKTGNYSMGNMENDQHEVVDDEYIHGHSEYLGQIAQKEVTTQDNRLLIGEFMAFVKTHEPGLIPVIEIIANTGTFGEARKELDMDEKGFQRCRNRLKVLKDCFMAATPVPKQRKEYKTRATAAA